MSEINLPPDLPVTEARTIRRALRLLEKYQRQHGEQFNSTTFTKTRLQLRLALQEREVFLFYISIIRTVFWNARRSLRARLTIPKSIHAKW